VEGNWAGVDFGADIAPADLYAFRSGAGLVFGVIADSAVGTIPNWYANPATVPPWEFRFADGTVLDTDSVTRLGQTRIGSPFNDTLQTFSDFASALIGLGGDDVLIGGAGNDLLDGGPGHDLLHGQAGNDIYLFGADSDVDFVDEQVFGGGSNGFDTVRFAADVPAADLSAERSFDLLTLRVVSSGAELQLPGWFAEPGGTVEIFQFADGTTWHAVDVEALLLPSQIATSGDDVLLGLASDDVLDGLEGDDVIYGFGGNDTLRGGLGNDVLLGGPGDVS
jgi:Ca2+-binding RTX toxin-like protein